MRNHLPTKIIIASVALLLGGALYFFYRPKEAIFFSWIRSTGVTLDLEHTRSIVHAYLFKIPDWIINSMPDGLWAFGYSLLISTIWQKHKSLSRTIWMISIPVVTIGAELIQLTEIIPGTFCQIDLIFIITGIITGYLIGIH